MNLLEFKRAVRKFMNECLNDYLPMPPEARVITGVYRTDLMIHTLMTEYGIEMLVEQNQSGQWKFKDYRVADEKKFAWFLMRWT